MSYFLVRAKKRVENIKEQKRDQRGLHRVLATVFVAASLQVSRSLVFSHQFS